MASKVFLFSNNSWLYCTDVSFKDNVWTGWVENGAWHLVFDTNNNTSKAYNNDECIVNTFTNELVWACDPIRGDYNTVIEDAKLRYSSNEPANYTIGPDKDLELYQKLKAKYENDSEYDLYLELREKYEDDEVAF